MRQLRVGLNLVPIAEDGGGVARYALELAAALAARDDLDLHVFISRDAPLPSRPEEFTGAGRITRLPVRLSGPPVHLLAQFGALPALALTRRLDVLHSPANAGPVRVPGVASVITLHDTTWLHAPEEWGTPAAVRTMDRVAAPTVRRADRVITVSESAARDIHELLGVPRDRIDVVHHGVRAELSARATAERELRERLGLEDDPVILCVGQKRRYKNQEALVRVLSHSETSDARLVLPGAPTPYEERLHELARETGVADRVHTPPWLSEPDLEALYRLARCLVLPSRLEGFGMPVLEAMARGVPVGCSNRSALPEVAGDAALLFDPDDDAAVAAAVDRLLHDVDLREQLAARGRARAAQFTWAAAADATVASYARALGG
jgi:glycosyltransferase involved in cell wall biosynthesis